jgi:hypothetical protein
MDGRSIWKNDKRMKEEYEEIETKICCWWCTVRFGGHAKYYGFFFFFYLSKRSNG